MNYRDIYKDDVIEVLADRLTLHMIARRSARRVAWAFIEAASQEPLTRERAIKLAGEVAPDA